MADKNFRIWMVRAGSGSWLIDDFLQENVVAIGWNDLGKLDKTKEYDEVRNYVQEVYGSEWSSGKLGQTVGQIWRFLTEFEIGDKVVTYDSGSREYYTGEIKSNYKYDESLKYYHSHEVKWDSSPIERDALSVDAKNTLGSILTVFEVPKSVWDELMKAQPGHELTEDEIEEIIADQRYFEEARLKELKEEVILKSNEFIKDIIMQLDPFDMEKLVAGTLVGMGYKARLTPRGSDLGSDIIASPDGLEMVEPIIKVEVKHKTKSKDRVSAPEIRNFVGGLRTTTKGIFVSSTGFAKEAKYEAERANFQITLVDLDRLVELLTEYYESLEPEVKALVPLKKIYWPL